MKNGGVQWFQIQRNKQKIRYIREKKNPGGRLGSISTSSLSLFEWNWAYLVGCDDYLVDPPRIFFSFIFLNMKPLTIENPLFSCITNCLQLL
jgi:hypothetical protein